MTTGRGPRRAGVDDDRANRALTQAILEDEGYTVVLAASGEQAVALFAGEAPDCVLLDIRMPGEDGFATCTRLRAAPRGPETPILFLTAMRDVEAFDHASMVGGDDFLTKPVRATDLLARVKTVLHLSRLDGTGVPEELREVIFERFVQLAVASDSRTGRGLGLAFCKLAVEAHGGRIWVEDGAPGAVFCLRLPRVPPVEPPPAAA